MADAIAAIDRVPDVELANALAAVPGSVIAGDRMAWGLRLGPDRAWSLASIANRMGLALGARDRHELDQLIARRDIHDPVVEITHDPDGCWLSLLDDWTLLVVSALRLIPGARERTAAGRSEVPVNRWTAETIRGWIDTHGLRVSPAAELALRENLTPALPRTDAATSPAPSRKGAAIVMDESGGHLILDAGDRNDLVVPFASLPTAQSWMGVGRRWLLSPTPEAARAVREMLRTLEGISLDDATTRWLEDAPRWIARIDVDRSAGGAPRLEITTRWGEPPEAIESITEPSGAGVRRRAALTPANLRLVGELLDSQREVTLGPATADALAWLRSNPDATSIPAGELDVVEEHGFTRFVLEPISDPDAEAAFLQQEAQLFRRHRQDHPGHPCLPADAWPPDELARLIRIRTLSCTAAAKRLVDGAMTTDEDAQRLLALSQAHDADITVEGLAHELMPFQRAGVAYALERRRVFLADEQGLGKTIQALATLQADAAFPGSSSARRR